MTSYPLCPNVPDPKDAYQFIVECGSGIRDETSCVKGLLLVFSSVLPETASAVHAKVLADCMAAILVGHPLYSKDEILELFEKNWNYAYKIQLDGEIASYLSSSNSSQIGAVAFIDSIYLLAKQKVDAHFRKGAEMLLSKSLLPWVGEKKTFDFNQEGWPTSKPKMG